MRAFFFLFLQRMRAFFFFFFCRECVQFFILQIVTFQSVLTVLFIAYFPIAERNIYINVDRHVTKQRLIFFVVVIIYVHLNAIFMHEMAKKNLQLHVTFFFCLILAINYRR